MRINKIVIVLTDKGYVAIESNEIFDLWKSKPFFEIYEELKQRYPAYKIHLGSMNQIAFKKAVEVSNHFLTNHCQLEIIKSTNITLKIQIA